MIGGRCDRPIRGSLVATSDRGQLGCGSSIPRPGAAAGYMRCGVGGSGVAGNGVCGQSTVCDGAGVASLRPSRWCWWWSKTVVGCPGDREARAASDWQGPTGGPVEARHERPLRDELHCILVMGLSQVFLYGTFPRFDAHEAEASRGLSRPRPKKKIHVYSSRFHARTSRVIPLTNTHSRAAPSAQTRHTPSPRPARNRTTA